MRQYHMGPEIFKDLSSILILEWGFWILWNNIRARLNFVSQIVQRTKIEIFSAEKLTVYGSVYLFLSYA